MANKEENSEKKEIKIPVFSVLKKGGILKHIFLNGEATDNISNQEEHPILIGRHPDCHIVLDHPSISRFHLALRVNPYSLKISITDLSSVHGTWVSGNKMKPRIPMDLVDGDTVKLGGSTRVYRFQWVALSRALEMESPLEALPEESEMINQEEIPSPLEPSSPEMEIPGSLGVEKQVASLSLSSRRRKSVGSLRIPSKSPKVNENNAEFQSCKVLLFSSGGRRESEEGEGSLNGIAVLDVEEELVHSNEENRTSEAPLGLNSNDLILENLAKNGSDEICEKNNMEGELGSVKENLIEKPSFLSCASEMNSASEFSCSQNLDNKPGELKGLASNEDMFNSKKNGSDAENSLPVSKNLSSNGIGSLNDDEKFICSYRENLTPEIARDQGLKKSIFKHCTKSEREGDPIASDKENMTPDASGVAKSKKPLSEINARIEGEMMKKRAERIPFQTLVDANSVCFSPSTGDKGNNACVDSTTKTASPVVQAQKTINDDNSTLKSCKGKEKKDWNIVVDTSCFLDKESRKSLRLLEGLRGTHLIIPRMVVRELDCMKRQEKWFRKATKASTALKWIEECMMNTSCWIHVQNSLDTVPTEGTKEWKSSRRSFSTCASLMEIVSPTVEDHILDTFLLFKRIRTDGHLVLLTNNIALKIKAMAEGLFCETPKEFRESLIDPHSKRFLWAESSRPRGSTWSCSDHMGLTENCYHQWASMRKTAKVKEGIKGLKVVLLHNSRRV